MSDISDWKMMKDLLDEYLSLGNSIDFIKYGVEKYSLTRDEAYYIWMAIDIVYDTRKVENFPYE